MPRKKARSRKRADTLGFVDAIRTSQDETRNKFADLSDKTVEMQIEGGEVRLRLSKEKRDER